jgi:uncharacterized SAM-binding protein YcdF (DUF218 family)
MKRSRRKPVRRRYNTSTLLTGGILLAILGLCSWVKWQSTREEIVHADAIVVLGAAQWNGRPSPVLRARLDRGIELFQQGWASLLVLTGGTAPGDQYSEAEVGRSYAIAQGVPPDAILIEEQSRTTVENLRGARDLLIERGLNSILLVSDPFHLGRSSIMARDLDLEPHPAPTYSSPISQRPLEEMVYIIREAFALIIYWVAGK